MRSFKKGLKNVKNIHEGVLLLVKLQASAKSNTPPWVFFTLFKLYKWYQIAQLTTYIKLLTTKPTNEVFNCYHCNCYNLIYKIVKQKITILPVACRLRPVTALS